VIADVHPLACERLLVAPDWSPAALGVTSLEDEVGQAVYVRHTLTHRELNCGALIAARERDAEGLRDELAEPCCLGFGLDDPTVSVA
jgi:hypothetical protein